MTRVIDQPVLVLNRHWQPVTVLSVGVSIATVVRGMGWVVHPETFEQLEFDAWCERAPRDTRPVRTPSGSVPAPEVIVLKDYEGQPRRSVTFTRRNLYRRDLNACQYCGRQAKVGGLTIDHVLPRSRGGPTSWENCVLACGPCNGRKADRTPREAGMTLRKQPRAPKWGPTFEVKREQYRPSWAPFLKNAAVEVTLH